MGISFSFFVVIGLVIIAILGANAGLYSLFGIIIPYVAFAVFLVGVIYRIVNWGNSPVPFRIPTTCGQQKTLPWIKQDKLDNPSTKLEVVGRMVLEVLFFRSLFRNTKAKLGKDENLSFIWEKWLWLAALVFHWSFFLIVMRHLRFFTEPVPAFVNVFESIDSFFGFGMYSLYLTDIFILIAVSYLFIRRVVLPQVRYVSLLNDYFPLLIIFGIASTGILMKYFYRVDVIAVKELAIGLITFSPVIPKDISSMFYIHIFLVSVLVAYFPFSKLMHAGGIFFSPTRNLANNSRSVRHINPWNYPVKVHTYEEYEDEFRKVMRATGLPLEKND